MTGFELDELNDKQRQAVEHVEGPLLILAGAGSGKTRVITNRVAFLVQMGIDPSSILALSFTNKAADEMRERVAELTSSELADDAHLSTFHSLGADILRRDIDVLGYRRPFTILDQGDRLAFVEEVMKDLDLDTDEVAPRRVASIISKAKCAFCEPADLDGLSYDPVRPYAQRIYDHYVDGLRGLNAVDFDDLLCLPVEIFRENEAIRKKYGERFKYVMVDEYQDTNETQLVFLRELVRDHRNICVVGDDDQSIYGFRGAVAENILDFEEEFEETRVIKLEQNYRSTNTILEAANTLIRHNHTRKAKELWSAKEEGENIRWVEAEDGEQEAEFVAAEIRRLMRRHRLGPGDVAILYRVNPQSKPFEKALNAQGLPFEVRGSTEFFDRREVKDFVAYLKVALNPEDELNLRRVVNVPRRGVGPTLLDRISSYADRENVSFFEALRAVADDPDLVHGIGHSVARRLQSFVETISTYHERLEEADDEDRSTAPICRELLDEIDLLDYVRSREEDSHRARERVGNVREVLDSIEAFEAESDRSLRVFLERAALDQSNPADPSRDDDAVQLMTLHASKGLEFPAVFVVGLEEGYLPHSESQDRRDDIAEERRLAYVGMTRAQRFLTLTSAQMRRRYGQELDREPSRFLEELPDDVVDVSSARDEESFEKRQEEVNRQGLAAMREAIGED